jgi:hypothetical protein
MLAKVVSPPDGESMIQIDTEATCETPALCGQEVEGAFGGETGGHLQEELIRTSNVG